MSESSPFPEPANVGEWMAVFHVYLDESGKLSGKSDYTCLGGFVASAAEWNRVSFEWNSCLFKWRIPPVHMSRIMASLKRDEEEKRDDAWKKKKHEWGTLWESRRNQFLEELAMIIHRSSLVCVTTLVDANAYRKIQGEAGCDLVWSDSNVFAFHNVLMRSIENIETIDRCAPIGVVLDDDPEHAKSYYDMLTTLRTHSDQRFRKVSERVRQITFCDDAIYPGLQAADLVAFVCRRFKVDDVQDEERLDQIPHSLYPHLTVAGVHHSHIYTEDLLRMIARGTYQLINHEGENKDGFGI